MDKIKNMLHHGHGQHQEDSHHVNSKEGNAAEARVDNHLIAEAVHYEEVEGNIYFPPSAFQPGEFEKTFTKSDLRTHCPWKGQSQYWDLHVGGRTLKNAAWSYPEPLEKAVNIKDHIAFDKKQVTTRKG